MTAQMPRGGQAMRDARCAGTAKPYLPGTLRIANRTARCPQCLKWVGVKMTGTLTGHTADGGVR